MPSSIPYDAILALVRYVESDECMHFEPTRPSELRDCVMMWMA
jgi:hypothetical protein